MCACMHKFTCQHARLPLEWCQAGYLNSTETPGLCLMVYNITTYLLPDCIWFPVADLLCPDHAWTPGCTNPCLSLDHVSASSLCLPAWSLVTLAWTMLILVFAALFLICLLVPNWACLTLLFTPASDYHLYSAICSLPSACCPTASDLPACCSCGSASTQPSLHPGAHRWLSCIWHHRTVRHSYHSGLSCLLLPYLRYWAGGVRECLSLYDRLHYQVFETICASFHNDPCEAS